MRASSWLPETEPVIQNDIRLFLFFLVSRKDIPFIHDFVQFRFTNETRWTGNKRLQAKSCRILVSGSRGELKKRNNRTITNPQYYSPSVHHNNLCTKHNFTHGKTWEIKRERVFSEHHWTQWYNTTAANEWQYRELGDDEVQGNLPIR